MIDKNYNLLANNEGNEIYYNQNFNFSISRISEDITSGRLKTEEDQVNVKEWFKSHFQGSVNEEHLPNVDILKSVL